MDRPVAAARLYATALGLYEMRLNGARVGDAVLAPGWTDYRQRIAYQTYDVTGLLRPGGNVLGAILADGWYSGFAGFDAKHAGAHYGAAPELLAQLLVRFAGGGETWVADRPGVAGLVRRDPARRPADGRVPRAGPGTGGLGPARFRRPRLGRPVGRRDGD